VSLPFTRLLIATSNAKKLAEFEHMLRPLELEIVRPADVGGLAAVAEDQPNFAANAAKKAAAAAREKKLWTLADDSGLEVDALDGAPGVHSARYAGEPCDDAKNNLKLLEALVKVPSAKRSARFVCSLALARPDGTLALEVEGEARGRILFGPRGTNDFGYDPLFLFTEPGFPQGQRAFAELSAAEKAGISHRGRALRALAEALRTMAAPPPDEPVSKPWRGR
jgi:XTP/dITP diphosphohydrolase